MVNLALLAFILQASWISTLPDESFIPVSVSSEDDDNMYLYMDTRAENDVKDSETHRRSSMDKNFARFGRGDLSQMGNYDYDLDYVGFNYARPTRSGGNVADKSSQFIRFGRGGKSDFIRFGRDPYKLSRVTREKDANFMRFGRSIESSKEKVRNKRSTDLAEEPKYFKRQPGNKNFIRFGRTPNNKNFMRFGREPEESQGVHYSHLPRLPTTIPSKLLSNELTRQSNTNNLKDEYILQLILKLMQKMQSQTQINLANPNSMRLS